MIIHVFVSPELPVTGWGVFAREALISTKEKGTRKLLAEGIQAPPEYCDSSLDKKVYETPVADLPPAYEQTLSTHIR